MFCLCACMCTMCIPGALGSQKRVLAALELDLEAVVIHHGDARNQMSPASL